jgi:hypothetical protein
MDTPLFFCENRPNFRNASDIAAILVSLDARQC